MDGYKHVDKSFPSESDAIWALLGHLGRGRK